MDREQLKTLLPHREPMLLLDTSEVVDGAAKGTFHVTGEEFFVQGHFPGNPVVPGVILCEMMAQNCCVLLGGEGTGDTTPYYTSLDKVRFKHPVVPGDTALITCSVTKRKGPFVFAQGTVHVGDTLCTTAEFSFALMPKEPAGAPADGETASA